ncbi:SCO family protein [Sulfurospirillum sp. 1612]|uniref:SCO family protein n=1 Tax=Sulfurospirillum sp. 1612 TaxID=3094835 RepID=UPI002F91C7B4
MKKVLLVVLIFGTIFLQADTPNKNGKVGTYEKLGHFVPLDLRFTDEHGVTKSLKEFVDGKPTVISVNYFHCPGICGPQIDSLTKSLGNLKLKEGKEYNALTISFVTTDTPKDAMVFKKNHTQVIKKSFDADAWHFLVTDNNQTMHTFLESLGYEYKKIVNKQGFIDYIHPTDLAIISPKGKITRYLEGIQYLPFDLQMALTEAGAGTVRPTITRALAFCYSFDPQSSKYVVQYKKIFGLVVSIFLIIIFLYFFITGKKHRKGDKVDE